jgi:hypothetical protein
MHCSSSTSELCEHVGTYLPHLFDTRLLKFLFLKKGGVQGSPRLLEEHYKLKQWCYLVPALDTLSPLCPSRAPAFKSLPSEGARDCATPLKPLAAGLLADLELSLSDCGGVGRATSFATTGGVAYDVVQRKQWGIVSTSNCSDCGS